MESKTIKVAYYTTLLVVTLATAYGVYINRPEQDEDPRIVANRIADEMLKGDDRQWHEIVGNSFVWTACRRGQEIVLIVDGSTGEYRVLDVQEQAICGEQMDELAVATLRLKRVAPAEAEDIKSLKGFNAVWLIWAAERSKLKY
jgi:hypothetical protein